MDQPEGGDKRRNRTDRRSRSRPRIRFFLFGGRRKSTRRGNDQKKIHLCRSIASLAAGGYPASGNPQHFRRTFHASPHRERCDRRKPNYGMVPQSWHLVLHDRHASPYVLCNSNSARVSQLLFPPYTHPSEKNHTCLHRCFSGCSMLAGIS